MKNNLLHTVFSLALLFIMVLQTLTFEVSAHYCSGNLKGVNFLTKAKSCHDKSISCPNHQSEEQKDDCCSNKEIIIEGKTNNIVQPSINVQYAVDLDSFAKTHLVEVFNHYPIDYVIAKLKFHPPPPKIFQGNTQNILFQTFLI